MDIKEMLLDKLYGFGFKLDVAGNRFSDKDVSLSIVVLDSNGLLVDAYAIKQKNITGLYMQGCRFIDNLRKGELNISIDVKQ